MVDNISRNRTPTPTSTHPETGNAVNAMWDTNAYDFQSLTLSNQNSQKRNKSSYKKMLLLMILTFFLNRSHAEKTKEVESKA